MTELRFTIADDLRELFPELLVGALLVRGLRAAAECISVDRLLADATAALATSAEASTIAEMPVIAGWREAIARCGLKPSTYRSSPEQLARRLLKGQSIRTPLPVVNAYCAVSARYLAPLGGYDVARLPGQVVELRFARPREDRFIPLGGKSEDFPLHPTVPVYAVGTTVLCWAFNHRDSLESSLLPKTDTALFIGEAVTSQQQDVLRSALQELTDVLSDAGAEVGSTEFEPAHRSSPIQLEQREESQAPVA